MIPASFTKDEISWIGATFRHPVMVSFLQKRRDLLRDRLEDADSEETRGRAKEVKDFLRLPETASRMLEEKSKK